MTGCQQWPVEWPCDVAGYSDEALEAASSAAQQLLAALSGYRIGLCTFREAFTPAANNGCGYPYKDRNGNWHNGWTGGLCCRVLLTHRPVESITEVSDGGVILDPLTYALEGSWLRNRLGCWNTVGACDDPELIVTYQAGVPFPSGTGLAIGEIGCEYLSALAGGTCRLPSRATSITRQGVTVTLDTASEFVGRGRIGLPVADAWLESVVGIGPRVASRVYSPDLPKAVRV